MSTDKSIEELLEIAQQTNELPKHRYDYGKPSIDNYVRMNKFKHTENIQFPNRMPSTLLYIDYQKWMTENYPEILLETEYNFCKEIQDYFNRYFFQGFTYLLMKVPKRLREYEHPHNVKYHEYMKRLWRTRKKHYAKKTSNKKPFIK